MKIKIYADGSDLAEMVGAVDMVDGFTTNPTLMRSAGVADYEEFAKAALEKITDHPISFEVFADEQSEMDRQARKLASWGDNVFVKIPIMNTKGENCYELISRLLSDGIKVNVTAVFSHKQIAEVVSNMVYDTEAILSVFAGRIADTGRDPKPFMINASDMVSSNVKVLWASCREVFNIYEAESIGCDIITVPNSLLKKFYKLQSKDLDDYSRETVQMFYDDATSSGFTL
jgi:transaldolase